MADNTTYIKGKKHFRLASNSIFVSTCWCLSRCYRRKHPFSNQTQKMLISERREMLSLMLDTFNPCSLLKHKENRNS